MSVLRPAADTTPAGWILAAARTGDAPTVLRYGPPGFDTYLRLPVDGNVVFDMGPGAGVHPMEARLQVLAAHTTTPDIAYVGVWHGHGFANGPDPVAPVVPLPNAWMYLFTGPVTATRYAQQTVWSFPDGTPDAGIAAEPDLVWPDDHSWCLACEVDEEIEFSIGCSAAVAAALEAVLPGRARRVAYGEDAPRERARR
ncbi:hypothetical protein [Nocardioides aurantiacus]|uniref:Uncharacterized protein n=1 Tax=Nocardioides aurantiacus TaxID=86796 RepID=A0A3N2CTU5_9ACTN|nr:hypothetical protein [Nocardioides aurantiacus]ROR90876.1 hypothetical protein EDD33_1725 [Nocardioides aurantiacus]